MKFSFFDRTSFISSLKSDHFDVVVIGGGVTGAGILLDAQLRGLKACLIEKRDFASGTSSRSTKLIHGGLRYLKQQNIKLVKEVGAERHVVARNAPQLVSKKRIHIPFMKGGSLGKLPTKAAMLLYEKLIGVSEDEKHQMFSKSDMMRSFPILDSAKLKGGVSYVEYATEDARLTLENIKTAHRAGAIPLNYAAGTGLFTEDGKISHVEVRDELGGTTFTISCTGVISAAGPWVDAVANLDKVTPNKLIHTKGVHLVIDRRHIPLDGSFYFDTPDGRMVFLLEKGPKFYLGTTDTFYEAALDEPGVTLQDVHYLLKALKHQFPTVDLDVSHVESSWSGVRPLIREEGKSPSEISRKDEVFVSNNGLVSIAGGKLTGYRKMASKALDIFLKNQNDSIPCPTDDQVLVGGEPGDWQSKTMVEGGIRTSLLPNEVDTLGEVYGSELQNVLTLYGQMENLNPEIPDLLFARLVYGVHCEALCTPSDFFIRRTEMLYFDIDAVKEYALPVTRWLSKQFQWSEEMERSHYEELQARIKEATTFSQETVRGNLK